ncbi:uncharacterized protein LOC124629039 [Tachysurus ichikawai]
MVVQQRTYQVPEAHRQAIEEEVERMLRDGIIEESTSNQSSPIMVVPKPDMSVASACDIFILPIKMSDFN